MRRIVLALLPVLAVFVGCGRDPARQPAAQAGTTAGELVVLGDAKAIRTAVVQLRPVVDSLEIPGKIQADPARVARVYPPVSGRVVSMEVRLGDAVREGQVLATLDSSDVSAARSDYSKARSESERTERAFQRATVLFENQILAEKDYQEARASRDEAASELLRAADRLRVLGISPDDSSSRLPVKAPRAGVVIDLGASPGELSKSLDSSNPICTVADLGTVWAVGDVQEKDLHDLALHAAASVTASAYPDEPRPGHIDNISETLDAASRTVKVRVVLANADRRLKPEMFTTIRVERSAGPRLVVPASSVLREGSGSTVLVQRAGGRFERRPVQTGRTFEANVEITSGLRAGEVIVIEGAGLLRPGDV